MPGFGALLSAVPEGYQQARQKQQSIDQTGVNQAGQAALGQWIQSQVPGASPIPTPQQSPQNPMQLIQGLIQRLSGGGQQQGGQPQPPQMGGGAPMPQPGPQQAQVPGARPIAPPTAPGSQPPGVGEPPPAAPGGQGGGMPPQMGPGAQGAGPQGGQPGYGGMTLQQLVQGIARSNPGVKDPRVLAAAVTQGMNLLKPEDQMMWRMAQMQNTQDYRNRSLDIREQGAGDRESKDAATAAAKDRDFAEKQREFDEREANAPSKQKAAEADRQRDLVVGQIDQAIAQLDKPTATGLPVTGWSGTAERAAEWAGGSLGMTDKTTGSDFQTQIRTIQTELPRVMLGVSRISAAERAHLDDMVRGLGGMTNPQTAKSALEHIKTVLQNSKKDQAQAPSRGGGQPSQAVKVNRDAARKAGYSDQEIDEFERSGGR